MISVILIALVLFLLGAQFLNLQWKSRGFPPGPVPFPIIGSVWWINFRADHRSLKKLAKTYGNICTLWMAHRPMVVLCGFQAVKNGLTNNSEDVSGRLQTYIFNRMADGKAEYSPFEKVQKELDAVVGCSHIFCYEDRKKLPYTNAVIHEIQRYSNILLIALPRLRVKDAELLGYHIPKNTMVLANIDSVLADAGKWETPHQFNPGHFLDQDGNFVNRETFLPFAIGHRVCMGELLARMELFIVFSTLLQAFTFTLPEGVKEVNTKFVFGSTMKPHPYQLCAVPR